MQFVILGSADSWYFRDLQRAAAGEHELVPLPFSSISAGIDEHGQRSAAGRHSLDECDAILVRTMPPGSLEQVVFRMDVLGGLARRGVPVINPPAAIEAAVDKYLTLARLQEAGLPVPRTVVCQTVDEAMEAFSELGEDVVIKPIFGGEGRGISRLADPDLAVRAFKMLVELKAVIYLQEFIPHHGFDLRVLVVGDQVLAMRRVSESDWRTNIGRGGRAEPVRLEADVEQMARKAAAAVGALVAGVDILPGRDGDSSILEVNGVPGWKALASTLDVDVARMMLDLLRQQVATPSSSWDSDHSEPAQSP